MRGSSGTAPQLTQHIPKKRFRDFSFCEVVILFLVGSYSLRLRRLILIKSGDFSLADLRLGRLTNRRDPSCL